jgi:hypothetical protein
MKKVKAFYNHHSEWIWACPVCNKKEYDGTFIPVADKAVPGEPGVCSKCYPEVLGATMVEVRKNVFVPGTDLNIRIATIEKADKEGRAYEIVFPKDKDKIMKELRKRDKANMNWLPGESLADIVKENKKHGVK